MGVRSGIASIPSMLWFVLWGDRPVLAVHLGLFYHMYIYIETTILKLLFAYNSLVFLLYAGIFPMWNRRCFSNAIKMAGQLVSVDLILRIWTWICNDDKIDLSFKRMMFYWGWRVILFIFEICTNFSYSVFCLDGLCWLWICVTVKLPPREHSSRHRFTPVKRLLWPCNVLSVLSYAYL